MSSSQRSRPNRILVGVAYSWIGTMPCNLNHRTLATAVMGGVRAALCTPLEINTIAISDVITMGTEGMRTSLVSREVIADSIELVGRGHALDGLVTLVGCDTTTPGTFRGREVTLQDVFEAVGGHAAGKISDSELDELEQRACSGAGTGGGHYTANTMAMAMEFLGLSPLGSMDPPTNDPRKREVCHGAGRLVAQLLSSQLTPQAILTKESSATSTDGSTTS